MLSAACGILWWYPDCGGAGGDLHLFLYILRRRCCARNFWLHPIHSSVCHQLFVRWCSLTAMRGQERWDPVSQSCCPPHHWVLPHCSVRYSDSDWVPAHVPDCAWRTGKKNRWSLHGNDCSRATYIRGRFLRLPVFPVLSSLFLLWCGSGRPRNLCRRSECRIADWEYVLSFLLLPYW